MRMFFPILPLLLYISLSALPALAQEEAPYQDAAPASAEPASPIPPPPATDIKPGQTSGPFYRAGIEAGKSSCDSPDTRFSCKEARYNQRDVMEIANNCIRTSFGTEERIMTEWEESDELEKNCVVPGKKAVNSEGKGDWSICCVQQLPKDDPAQDDSPCFLACTRYMDQK